MKYHEIKVEADSCYLFPFGDIHIGDKNTDYGLAERNIDWVKNTPDTYVVGTGDWLNCATMGSKSSVFTQDMDLTAQIERCVKLFEPIKDRILGVVSGNHEQRMESFAGYNPLGTVCQRLDVPYFGYSGVVVINVGLGAVKRAYTGYLHHTTGGGNTPGGKINRVNALRSIVSNCDFYLGGHNHSLGAMPTTTRCVDVAHKTVKVKRQMLIDCGSYLKWDEGYAEMKGLEPTKLGSPRLRFNGTKRDIHVSL